VSNAWRIVLKIGATVLAAWVAFSLGSLATTEALERFFSPGLVKQNPHNGMAQLGVTQLFVLVWSLYTGIAIGVVVLVIGIVWTVKTSRPKRDLNLSIGE